MTRGRQKQHTTIFASSLLPRFAAFAAMSAAVVAAAEVVAYAGAHLRRNFFNAREDADATSMCVFA